jgi:ABC-type nitrate/sulfonate/bicarbonate transport system substrate-binding protein
MMRFPSRATFLSSAAAGLAGVALPRIARAQATTPIRMAGVFSDLFAEPFYASAAGAFAKRGFDVEASSLSNAGAVAAAIGGGSLEMGVGDLISGVNAIVAGVPIVLVAGGGLYRTPADQAANILAVASASPIHSPADIIGKSIGVPTLVGLTTVCLRAWLPAHGVPLSSVRLVEIPPPTAVPALQRGTIDVALLSEPFVTIAKGDIRAVGYPFDAAADHAVNHEFCVSVWYASKAWVDQDRDRAHRALEAIYETARWSNTHHDETLAILIRNGKLDADKIRGLMRVAFATSLTPDLIAPVLDIGMQEKVFSKPVDANILITKL